MKKFLKTMKKGLGIFFLIEFVVSIWAMFTELKGYPIIAFLTCLFFGVVAFLLLKQPKNTKDVPSNTIPGTPTVNIEKPRSEPNMPYVETAKTMHRVDGGEITNAEIPRLIQAGYESAIKQEEESSNPKFHRSEREDDLCFNFEENHSSEIEYHVNKFEELCCSAYAEKDLDTKIELLKQTIIEFDKAKKWFYRTKGGQIYFEDMYEHLHNSSNPDFSYIDSVQEYLNYCIQKKNIIFPQILSAIGENGILQKDIYALVDSDKSIVQKVIRELANENKILREKKGSSYFLTLK